MALDMYGAPSGVYVPLGSGKQYVADSTGLITAVATADVPSMREMGCEGKAVLLAAAALGQVITVAGRSGAVVLAKADITDLGTVGTAAALSLVTGFAKHALVAGGTAGNITITGIKTTDTLNMVLHIVGAVTAINDLTSEFTISALNTINNTSGTATTGNKLLVLWTATT